LKTDSIFYRIFQTDPGILFELLGQSADLAVGYEFRSVEIKQLAFRIDGVLLPKPDAPDQTVWFIEVQFQKDPYFYHRFFAEIGLFIAQHPEIVDWQAVVLFPSRSVEPDKTHLHRAQLNSGQVHRVYLNELKASETVGIGLMQLILADGNSAIDQAQRLVESATEQTEAKRAAIIKLIETILIYKFPRLSRAEIESMFGLSELKQTKVYQEALQEGKQEGEATLVLRLLSRRFGTVSSEVQSQIQSLSLPQLEALADALLDFSGPAELREWLRQVPPQ
jgi:predicted transposase/invertase (TIGR01784 family)